WWEAQAVEGREHAAGDGGVREVGAPVARVRDGAVPADHEAHGDATLEVGVAGEAPLVTHPETAEVLAHHPLDDLGRQAAAHRRVGRTDARCRGHVRVGGATAHALSEAVGTETLAGPEPPTMPQGADVAQTDAGAPSAAPVAVAREPEPTAPKRITDIISPHVALGAEVSVAQGRVAAPGSRRCGGVAGAALEHADHAETSRFLARGGASEPQVRLVLG